MQAAAVGNQTQAAAEALLFEPLPVEAYADGDVAELECGARIQWRECQHGAAVAGQRGVRAVEPCAVASFYRAAALGASELPVEQDGDLRALHYAY